MASIHNSDLTKELIEKAKLQTSHDSVPSQIADKVIPTLEVNPNLSRRTKIVQLIDETIDDQEKTWYVPAGKKWKFLWGKIKYQADANVGNRQLMINILNASTELWIVECADQAESTTIHYHIGAAHLKDASVTAVCVFLPFPKDMIMFAGDGLMIWDDAGISGADDMKVTFYVEETDLLVGEVEARIGADA